MRKSLLVAFAIISFSYSCTKISSTDIGAGLIPPIDGVITKDTTLNVFTTTREDSSLTRVYKSDDHVIGVINNDPLFGKTTASAFFELKPQFFKYFFPGTKANLIADSAVLVLSYRGFYGDTIPPQTWRVFEINTRDTLKFDSAYSTNTAIGFANQIGVKNNIDVRRLGDSVKYGFENSKNQIRIRLSDAFAQRMIRQYDSSNAYASDKELRKNFAGFAVVPDQGSGNALIKVNLLDTNTKLSLYYSSQAAQAKRDTAVVYFKFRLGGEQTSGNANRIVRDRTGAAVSTAILNPAANDVYIQTMPGTFATVRIPGLTTFPNSIIHRAELIAEQAVENDLVVGVMAPPRYLLLSAYDSAAKQKINVPNDFEIDGAGVPNFDYFGGLPGYKTVGTQRVASYNFNLSRYVQGIISRKDKNLTLFISAPTNDSFKYTSPYPNNFSRTYYTNPGTANNTADGRVRLKGGTPLTNPNRMRLRIIYSRL
jgi:hypothetical protein